MRRTLLVAAASTIGALAVVPSAQALTRAPVWKCRASAAHITVAGNNRVEPVVANGNINTANGGNPDHAQCVSAEAGAGNTATQLGVPTNFLGASSAQAKTDITPELGPAATQRVTSTGRVENLNLLLPAGAANLPLGVTVADSTTTGSCVNGAPRIDGNATGVKLTLAGAPIDLDPLLTALSNALAPLDQIVQLKVNEKVVDGDSLAVRGLRLTILPRGGGPAIANVVVGESKVGINGAVCSDTTDGTTPPDNNGICPKGSQLDAARKLCIIPAGAGGSSLGQIIVGRPFQGPSGGTVVPLDVARRRFGRKSPCLAGKGKPLFAIVGTNKADRITGSNIADRIIGLGGNDRLDGGRGNDCIEGRTGGDNISGALGNDRLFGASGKDHLNGGPGKDRMSAGSGNDTINAAFGKDVALGGDGRDFINIATAGPAASANCGKGRDKVRINRNERKKTKGCETKYVFNDK